MVVPEDLSAQEYLKILCFNGLNRKYPGFTPLLESRLNKEIEILYAVGFIEGFLIVHDLIDHARSNNILISPGRGALPGSLAAYCLGITGVDPIKYDLLFEHYVNKESAAYINEPYMKHFNIWIDVELGGKQRITDHIIEK